MDFNERNPLSISSLAVAVQQNSADVTRELIKRGRNVNIADNRGWTPLHEAAAWGHIECLKIIIEANARLNVKTHKGETALFLACENNRFESVKVLLDRNNELKNIPNNESVTPLHVACSRNFLPIAELLLKKKARINAEDNSGCTPLHDAVLKRHLNITKLLIDKGADVKSREYYSGNLVFHFACMNGDVDIFKLLLNCYSNDLNVINSKNCDGSTPLMLAVQAKSIEIIKILLDKGADPNVARGDDLLPLHLAVYKADLDVLKCILNVTSVDAINMYCTLPTANLRIDNYDDKFPTKSLVYLAIESESVECLDFVCNCGFNYEVLNCPIISTFNLRDTSINRIEIEIDLNAVEYEIVRTGLPVVLHPITFLLREKIFAFESSKIKQMLEIMLRNGLFFHSLTYESSLPVIYPLEGLFSRAKNPLVETKKIVIESVRLLIEHGVIPDHNFKEQMHETIPAYLLHALLSPVTEIVLYLLKYCNLVDIDDLLMWLENEILNFKGLNTKIENVCKHYNYLIEHSSVSNWVFLNELYNSRRDLSFLKEISFKECMVPRLKNMCRGVIRKTVRSCCLSDVYKFKIRLNSLEIPMLLLSFLNYDDMLLPEDGQ